MDVEKLKKINQLSVEFKKHGMAVSHDDAFAKASEVVRDDELKDVLAKTSIAEQSSCACCNEKQSSSHSTSFDNQYQIMLERQNRQLVQEIMALKETIAMLKSDVEQLKSNAARPVIIQQVQPKQEKQAVLQEKKESSEKSHPKQGNYTSEDVAIEKMFYYGKK
ncbi:MAG: hypothetical protein QW666_01600 [Candidatus Woesearchaeota archaeon]